MGFFGFASTHSECQNLCFLDFPNDRLTHGGRLYLYICPPLTSEITMNWLLKKFTGEHLEQLKNGDIVYSKRLDVQATVLGYKHFNGFMHYRLKYERIGSEPIEKLISPAGLEIEGFEKSA